MNSTHCSRSALKNRPIIDGGQYVDGVISGASGTIIYDGGLYANGAPVPPLFSRLSMEVLLNDNHSGNSFI